MARLDWDRLRRVRPLDGADARVDPDGVVLWDRSEGPPLAPGVRRLREGIVVRRARERKAALADPDPRPPLPARPSGDASSGIECPRCKERVPKRKLLLHLRVACEARP